MELFNPFYLAGLSGLAQSLINDWIGPIFIVAVAVFAVVFIKNRQFTALAGFVVIAVIVGLLIFFGGDLFGSGGKLTTQAKNLADNVNLIYHGWLSPIIR